MRRHVTEILATLGISIAAAGLLVLVWLNESNAIAVTRGNLAARIEATTSGQAIVLADEIRRELLGVEQSLTILKQAFQAAPEHFDMQAWLNSMPVLTDVVSDVFIADEQRIIRQDINPTSVGLSVETILAKLTGATAQRTDTDDGMLIGSPLRSVRKFEQPSSLSLDLDRPDGWTVGALFRTVALARMYAEANLGILGITALIDTEKGRVLAIAGAVPADWNNAIAQSAMFEAMKERQDGIWVGASAPDGIERIHGFHRVPGRDLAVVVAVNRAEAMRPAGAFAEGARLLAWGSTAVITIGLIAALHLVWTLRDNRRLRDQLYRESALVNGIQSDLAEIRAQLDHRVQQIGALSDGIDEGLLVVDADLRPTEWNERFAVLAGVDLDWLQSGMPLDDLLRNQVRRGDFGTITDIEGEVARRIARLRSGEPNVHYRHGRQLSTSARPLREGGLLLLLREHEPGHASVVFAQAEELGPSETF